jgi:hypothetical protein
MAAGAILALIIQKQNSDAVEVKGVYVHQSNHVHFKTRPWQ